MSVHRFQSAEREHQQHAYERRAAEHQAFLELVFLGHSSSTDHRIRQVTLLRRTQEQLR